MQAMLRFMNRLAWCIYLFVMSPSARNFTKHPEILSIFKRDRMRTQSLLFAAFVHAASWQWTCGLFSMAKATHTSQNRALVHEFQTMRQWGMFCRYLLVMTGKHMWISGKALTWCNLKESTLLAFSPPWQQRRWIVCGGRILARRVQIWPRWGWGTDDNVVIPIYLCPLNVVYIKTAAPLFLLKSLLMVVNYLL